MTAFLDFYHGHSQRLNDEIFTASEMLKDTEEEINKIDDRLTDIAPLDSTGESSHEDK